jgi:murein DD-endopeptidase MepM/ murein hydrolase activator NlpD
MSRIVELLCSRRLPQVAVLALMSVGFAGCSADMGTRMSQSSLSNPFTTQQEATSSVPPAPVERRELPQYSRPQSQYQSSALPPPISAPQSYSSASGGISGSGGGVSSYAPPSRRPLETTGSVAPRSVAGRPAMPGGTTIIVGTSDTREILSRRYHVSPAAIMQANGYKGPRVLSPGQQLIIPHPTASVAAAPALVAPISKPVAALTPTSSIHVVNRGDTLLSIARRNHVSVPQLARANNLDSSAKLSIGMKLVVPGSKTAAASPAAVPPAVAAVGEPVAVAAAPVTRMAAADNQQKVRLAQAAPNAEEPAVVSPIKAEATGALPTFRWPVRGKVITAYGAKANGKANDGINLAVPEGTPVKAADDGVVAYSGNELKGYGNLVLIRHANGYVTAYAHASELLVKRGDTIKRGQVIAKSGQSGEVQSPQLHFEIRKGSSPVDPLQFLNGA